MLTTKLLKNSNYWTLQLIGELIVNTARALTFQDVLQQMLNTQVRQLLIDFSGVDTIDASGIRLLLATKKEFNQNGIQIILLNLNSNILRLFKIIALDHIFEIRLK